MPAHRPRILCTEDDSDTRDLLRVSLGLQGFQVICAEDAEQAIRLARSSRFDLYLLDHWLPGVAGDLFCQKLREFDSTTPILFYLRTRRESRKAQSTAFGAQRLYLQPAHPD